VARLVVLVLVVMLVVWHRRLQQHQVSIRWEKRPPRALPAQTETARQKFIDRAKRDGVSTGQLFRALIYGYAEGKDTLKLPPTDPKK